MHVGLHPIRKIDPTANLRDANGEISDYLIQDRSIIDNITKARIEIHYSADAIIDHIHYLRMFIDRNYMMYIKYNNHNLHYPRTTITSDDNNNNNMKSCQQ